MNASALRTALLVVGSLVIGCGGEDAKGPTMIRFSTCAETFTACGGNEFGTWSLASTCVNSSLADSFNQMIAVEYPNCGQSFTDMTMSSTGAVTYDGINYARTGSLQSNGKMAITSACLAEQIPGLVLTANSCSNLAKVLPTMYPGTTFNCAYGGGTCNCDTNSVQTLEATGTYVKSGNSIIESVDQVAYSYCINGDEMSQYGRLGSTTTGVLFSGITHLTKQ